jgi:hypothetical protein
MMMLGDLLGDPLIDFAFDPSAIAMAELYLFGELAVSNALIDRAISQAGFISDNGQAYQSGQRKVSFQADGGH